MQGQQKQSPMTKDQLGEFIGVVYGLGVTYKRGVEQAFSHDEMLGVPWVRRAMTLAEFQRLKTFLSSDVRAEGENDQHNIASNRHVTKIGVLLDMFKERCLKAFSPSENLSYDEQVAKTFSHYCKLRQLLKHKKHNPIQWLILQLCHLYARTSWPASNILSSYRRHPVGVFGKRENHRRKTKWHYVSLQIILASLIAMFLSFQHWRVCSTKEIDVIFYTIHNKDLNNAQRAGTANAAINHFCRYGFKEGRERRAPVLSHPRNLNAGSKAVIVSHPWGGGTQTFVLDALTALSSKMDVQLVQCDICPRCGEEVQFGCGVNGNEFEFLHSFEEMKTFFDALLADVYFLNFLFPHETFMRFFASINRPIVYTAHDHQAIRYSDQHEMHLSCADDSPIARSQIDEENSANKAMFLDVMRRSVILTTPSLQNVKFFGMYYPQITFQASQPRPQWNPTQPRKFAYMSGEIRILSIALSNSKGANTFNEVSSKAKAQKLPFMFFMLGKHSLSHMKRKDFTDVGPFLNNEDALNQIQKLNIDLIWFPARRHESYCYALDLALATGLPIVATRTGSFSERLCNRDTAWLIDGCLDADNWIQVFRQLWKSPNLLQAYKQFDCANNSYSAAVVDQIIGLKPVKVQAIDANTAAQFVALNPKYIIEGSVHSLEDIKKALASDSYKYNIINSRRDIQPTTFSNPGRCKNCHNRYGQRRYTKYGCATCETHLCVDCMAPWHETRIDDAL